MIPEDKLIKKARKNKFRKQFEKLPNVSPSKKAAGNRNKFKRPLEGETSKAQERNPCEEPPKKKPKKNNKFKFPENVKSKVQAEEEPEEEPPSNTDEEATSHTNEAKPKVATPTWTNRQRVLILSSRGVLPHHRHLMLNLRSLLPHHKPEIKRDPKVALSTINQLCEQRSCNKCLYFTSRKEKDLYLWASNVPDGPSAKFLVENASTMEEIKLPGNCLRGSQALLSFDKSFQDLPQYALIRELFVQIFATPRGHPRSQPCVDHVMTFALLDNRIWFRNYQILDGGKSLSEIGPRIVLNLVKIYSGSFGGPLLYSNPHYRQLKLRRQLVAPEETGSSSSDNEE